VLCQNASDEISGHLSTLPSRCVGHPLRKVP
jgi:hypothetical protein